MKPSTMYAYIEGQFSVLYLGTMDHKIQLELAIFISF